MALGLLVVLEGSVRLFSPQGVTTDMEQGEALVVRDSMLGHRLTPGAVMVQQGPEFTARYVINTIGHRDRTVTPSPRSGLQILLLGDSFAFGYGNEYEEGLAGALETVLWHAEHEVRVINAGVPGYDTRTEVQYLERLWEQTQPDIVVLVFLANDLFTNRPLNQTPSASAVVRRAEKEVGWLHVVALLRRWILHSDALYRWSYRQTAQSVFFSPAPNADVQKQFVITEALLRRLHLQTQAHGVPLVVVSIPQQIQVLSAATSNETFDARSVDLRLKRTADALGFPWITTLDPLASAYARGDELYYRLDGHLTPVGNRVVAAEAARYLQAVLPLLDHRTDPSTTTARGAVAGR